MAYIQLLAGLAILVVGGETLVRGAVAIADRLGLPRLLVGLTIVALGTSAPEITVSIGAALKGAPDLVTGNVVGSNISNILLVLGVAAIISPIHAQKKIVRRDALFLVLVSSVLAGLCIVGVVSPLVGGMLIIVYAAYTIFSYLSERGKSAESRKDTAGELAADEASEHGGVPGRLLTAVPIFLGGCIAVVIGADLLVDGAVEIAHIFSVPEAVIGLTLLAIGTSLPELAISIIAALRGHSDVALGNVVGSNITNILVVLGATAMIGPIPVAEQIALFDIWVMLAATIILLPVLVSGWQLSRFEATLFVSAFVIYIVALFQGWPLQIIKAFPIN